MLNFQISQSKCIQCGICSTECPVGIIEMNELPTIPAEKEAQCVKCQHCLAVCPTEALSILDKDPADSIKNTRNLPDPSAMGEMIKTRRATRKYKQESLDKEFIHELLETASYAPTGHNDNGVQFTVLDDTTMLHKLRDLFYASVKNTCGTDSSDFKMNYINQISKLWEDKGIDMIFRDAPHLVIASVPENHMTPLQDGLIALSYFELLANSHGIGTLWAGMIKTVIDEINPDLRKTIGIPDDHLIVFSMLFGKPAVKYARSVQSEGIHIKTVQLN